MKNWKFAFEALILYLKIDRNTPRVRLTSIHVWMYGNLSDGVYSDCQIQWNSQSLDVEVVHALTYWILTFLLKYFIDYKIKFYSYNILYSNLNLKQWIKWYKKYYKICTYIHIVKTNILVLAWQGYRGFVRVGVELDHDFVLDFNM